MLCGSSTVTGDPVPMPRMEVRALAAVADCQVISTRSSSFLVST